MMCCGHLHEQLNGDFDFFENGIASDPGAGLFVHLDMELHCGLVYYWHVPLDYIPVYHVD